MEVLTLLLSERKKYGAGYRKNLSNTLKNSV